MIPGTTNLIADGDSGIVYALSGGTYKPVVSGDAMTTISSILDANHIVASVGGVVKKIAVSDLIGSHTHDDRYFTETEADARFAALSHTHDDRYYTEAEVDALLSALVVGDHNHDDRYYTESEIDTALALKSDATHTHDSRYYTETEIDAFLAAYSLLTHNHDATYAALSHTHNHGDLTLDDGTNPHSTTKADVGLGSVENTALTTWGGSANIATVGTITTGVWNSDVIDKAYLDVDVTTRMIPADFDCGTLTAVTGAGNYRYQQLVIYAARDLTVKGIQLVGCGGVDTTVSASNTVTVADDDYASGSANKISLAFDEADVSARATGSFSVSSGSNIYVFFDAAGSNYRNPKFLIEVV